MACFTFVLAACDAPIVGNWETDSKLDNGERNSLEVYDDFTGFAEVMATTCRDCNDWQEFEFEIEWEDLGTEFELDMECKKGPCDGSDFRMDCEIIEEDSGDEKMDCTGNGKWDMYVFDWQRAE